MSLKLLHNLFEYVFRFDVGDIVMQIEYQIKPRITAKQLKAELAPIGAQLVIKWLFWFGLEINS